MKWKESEVNKRKEDVRWTEGVHALYRPADGQIELQTDGCHS